MAKQKYNPVLGQHIADFTEQYRMGRGLPLESSLQEYGKEHSLPRKDLYEIARYLEDHGWPINASVLSPDLEEEETTGLEGASVFDRYFGAIKEKRYEDAHDIYESMAPSEQQVIKDRRATVFNKMYKIAQKAQREGWQDIVTKIASLWEEHPELLAESYRSVLEELAAANEKMEKAKVEGNQETVDFLMPLAKELESTKKQMETLMEQHKVEHPLVEDAVRLLNPQSGVEKFRAALLLKDWEAARDVFTELSPEDQAKASEVAREMFHVAEEVISLHKLGAELFAQGKYIEAADISEIVQACLPEMEIPEGQQIVLLIVDPQLVKNLPQAFEAQEEQQGPPVGDILQSFRDRALPGQGLGPHGPGPGRDVGLGPCKWENPQTFNKVIELANMLDDKGHTVEADMLDTWLVKMAEEIKEEKKREVKTTKCHACGTELYYTEGTPQPKWCRQCMQDPWAASKVKGSLQTAKKEDPAVTKCETCGAEIFYRPEQGRPRWCPQCLKGPWNPSKISGSLNRGIQETAKKKKSKPKMKEGKPAKVIEIADAIRRDEPGTSDEKAYRMAWETYCSYVNPGYSSCTPKGKSKRKSPKPYSKASMSTVSPSVSLYDANEKYQGDFSLDRAIELEDKGFIVLEQTPKGWIAHKVKPEDKKE